MDKMRIKSFDTLRGFAIAVMIIDHIFAFILGTPIEAFNIRFFTRIAEPLFALLLGYFLIGRRRESLFKRGIDISVALVLSNLLFYAGTKKLEILTSFMIVYIIYYFLQDRIIFLLPAVFLYPLDPTKEILDYALTIVLTQVSLGAALRRMGNPLISLLILPAIPFFIFLGVPTYSFSIAFTIPAVLMLLFAESKKDITIPVLEYIGKNPLKVYVAQFYVIFAIRIFIDLFIRA